MINYRFIHQGKVKPVSMIGLNYNLVEDICDTEYVPPYRIYKLLNGSITIEIYSYMTVAYTLILEVLQNHLPHKSADITIVTSLGAIIQVFIEPTDVLPNYVGYEIPKGELYQQVSDIVTKYYPNFEYHQFTNGFLVRPLYFIKMAYYNNMLGELIAIYQHHYEIYLSYCANRGVVISLMRTAHR